MGLLDAWQHDIQRSFSQVGRAINEAVFPPVDVVWSAKDVITVKVDLAGFNVDNIDVELERTHLVIEAERDSIEDEMKKNKPKITVISSNRPLKVFTRIPLPLDPFDEKTKDIKLGKKMSKADGVLTITIVNIPKGDRGKPTND